jgi:fructokinase
VLLLCGTAKLDNIDLVNLYSREVCLAPHASGARALVVGEVLWDRFPDATRLGGAPLNFAVHFNRLQHAPLLVSALGTDAPGEQARLAIAALGLDTTFLHFTDRFSTGSAVVRIGPGEQTSFAIERPAAYDAVELSEGGIRQIVAWNPTWFYYGTLFPSCTQSRSTLYQLLNAVPNAARFYDLNLRPGFEAPPLVDELLRTADVVKVNERELQFVHERLDFPPDPEGFCRAGFERYQWRAACVTLGARGCAMLLGEDYAEAPGFHVAVADPVGTGDAFAAAFIHGIVSDWPVADVARFSNRVGALVAATRGAIPDAASEDANPGSL